MSTRLLMLGPVNHPHVEHLALAMHARGYEVIVAGDTERTLPASVLPAAGLRLYAAPAHRRRSGLGIAAHVRWIRSLCRDLRPDVVHAHWLCGFAAFAALARASPLVVMGWGSDVFRAGTVKTLANRIALRRATIAMADSRALLDRMAELGARPEASVLVNWGVDLELFSPPDGPRAALRERLGLTPGRVVLSPRSLTPVYNPRTIIEAFGRIASDFPDAQLVLKHMAVEALDLGPLPDRVHVAGHVSYARMADYYRAADVCVSIASSDSSPRSVWEAMACACPVVLSDLPWVHELITPEREALVVPIDAGALAEALRRVLSDSALARGLGDHGRTLVEAHRDSAAEMDRLADVYRALAPR